MDVSFDDVFLKPVKTQEKREIYEKDFIYKTPKITFNMHYKHKMISVEELKKFLVDDETKVAHCNHVKPCNNFGNCYSCPPIAPRLEKYNPGYKNCLVYSFWVDWDFKINSDNVYFKLINANRTVSPYAWDYGMKLEKHLGGKVMIDGRCPICKTCKKKLGEPCAFPKRRRSSLEAVGVHATNLCEEILQHKIEWYKKVDGKIVEPAYITVIHGFLTNAEQPEVML